MENADTQPVPDLGQIDVKPEYCHLFLIHCHLQEKKNKKSKQKQKLSWKKKYIWKMCVKL